MNLFEYNCDLCDQKIYKNENSDTVYNERATGREINTLEAYKMHATEFTHYTYHSNLCYDNRPKIRI